ncbi:MAG: DUF3299 domain-containing protein [Bdellovibrionales bacterium]|nr:DUF3299 domain-containing protein [Bdellovibrionales bacterium]
MRVYSHLTKITFLLLLLLVQSCTQTKKNEPTSSETIRISWKDLQSYQSKKDKLSPQVQKILSNNIKIAGFITPLEDDIDQATEFLLIPEPVECIHSALPAQKIWVILQNSFLPTIDLQKPFWVYGRLKAEMKEHPLFTSALTLQAQNIEPYQ